jgi:drug/metabolite transporter (DMT)-like permease
MWGAVVTMIRVISRDESSVTITLYLGLFMTPMTLIPAIFVWQTPTVEQLGWLVLISIFGSLNQLFVAQALKDAEVTAVMPMDFTRLIWSAIFGYMFYAEVPDIWTWLGAVLIFSSTTYITFRERALRSAAQQTSVSASKPPPT